MSDLGLFDSLPLPEAKRAALAGLPASDQQVFREWLQGVLVQQVDSFLTVGLRQVGAALTGIQPCEPSPPEVTQAFKRRWVGAGRPASGWEEMAREAGMADGLAARLVRRWLREHARHVRDSAVQQLVLAGAGDWQISSWLGASHAEIQEARLAVGVLPAFAPFTDAVSDAVWRHWVSTGAGKGMEVMLALHTSSGVALQKLGPAVTEWVKTKKALER